MKMSKFEVIRTDLNNKIVMKAQEWNDAEYCAGQYIFALSMSGLMKADAYTHTGGEFYTLHTNRGDWKIEVREVK